MGFFHDMNQARDQPKTIKQLLYKPKSPLRKKHSLKHPKSRPDFRAGQSGTSRDPLYILFDLDGTLISVDIKGDMELPTNSVPSELCVKNRFINSAGQSVVQDAYLRPGVKDMLEALLRLDNAYQPIKVGIWTSSFRNYSEGIAKLLFGHNFKDKLFCFMSTDEINGVRCTYDILNNRHLTGSKLIDKKVMKDLNQLFNDPIYGTMLNAKNTVLIDDTPLHKQHNPRTSKKNVLLIKTWDPASDPVDDKLRILSSWIAKLSSEIPINRYLFPKLR
jgi:hypothetical protein